MTEHKYSTYPFRKCINCTGLGDCPAPKVDIEGHPHYPDYCPIAEKKANDTTKTGKGH
jgi:hypothetical protein